MNLFPDNHRVHPEAHPRPRRPLLIFREEKGAASRKFKVPPPRTVAGVRVGGGGGVVVRSAAASATAAARPGLRPQLCLLLDVQDSREHAQEPTEIR